MSRWEPPAVHWDRPAAFDGVHGPNLCRAHRDDGTVASTWACSCTSELLFKCEVCGEFAVREKSPGWGYVCDKDECWEFMVGGPSRP